MKHGEGNCASVGLHNKARRPFKTHNINKRTNLKNNVFEIYLLRSLLSIAELAISIKNIYFQKNN